jgi:inosose dehydratase
LLVSSFGEEGRVEGAFPVLAVQWRNGGGEAGMKAGLSAGRLLLMITRRTILQVAGAMVPGMVRSAEAGGGDGVHVSANTYGWGTYAGRDGRGFSQWSDEALGQMAAAGQSGFEPGVGDVREFDGLGEKLKRHGLEMRSVYVGTRLENEESVRESVAQVQAIAAGAAALGGRILVTNPVPVPDTLRGKEADDRLRWQVEGLNRLGEAVAAAGMVLALHHHDAELRAGAREFHHGLSRTDPAKVKLCLDVHWVYRGCGDSGRAVDDALERYSERIVALHLRQSRGGRWSEVFTAEGDIDYVRVAAFLRARKIKPLLILEQCIEQGTPHTMDGLAAHRAGVAEVRRVFA